MPNGARATPGRFWTAFSVSPCVPGICLISSIDSVCSTVSSSARLPRTVDVYGSLASAWNVSSRRLPGFNVMGVSDAAIPGPRSLMVCVPGSSVSMAKRPSSSVTLRDAPSSSTKIDTPASGVRSPLRST